MISINFKKVRFQNLCASTVTRIGEALDDAADDIGSGCSDLAEQGVKVAEAMLNTKLLMRRMDKRAEEIFTGIFDKKLAKKFRACFEVEGLEELRPETDECDED